MSNQIRPMRACKVEDSDLQKLSFPLLGSPKFDGIRCIVCGRVALSNTLKPIPNVHIQNYISKRAKEGLDGEIVLNHTKDFSEVQSAVMSRTGIPDFSFQYFDIWNHSGPFLLRDGLMRAESLLNLDPRIVRVEQELLMDLPELLDYEQLILSQGYEGICLRDPHQMYKFGRSTFNQAALLKRKPFHDAEATIIGFIEQEENQNEKTQDERGYTKRSSHNSGKLGKATLGAFRVTSVQYGEFNIGTGVGLTDQLRQRIWADQDSYLGRALTYKYQLMGTKDKPRIPIFKHFRHGLDIAREDR